MMNKSPEKDDLIHEITLYIPQSTVGSAIGSLIPMLKDIAAQCEHTVWVGWIGFQDDISKITISFDQPIGPIPHVLMDWIERYRVIMLQSHEDKASAPLELIRSLC